MIRNLLRKWISKEPPARDRLMDAFKSKYSNFKTLLDSNSELLKIISDIEGKLRGQTVFGLPYIEAQSMRAIFHCARMIQCFENMAGKPYPGLHRAMENIQRLVKIEHGVAVSERSPEYTLPYHRITRAMVESVGGKNANICEVQNGAGLPIPGGFAVTTTAFDRFIAHNRLSEAIRRMKLKLDVIETETIVQVSDEIQQAMESAEVPEDVAEALFRAYDQLAEKIGPGPLHVSVRSSAIGEDSSLSFAGQYLTLLNVPRDRLLEAYKKILASLFTPRAISYRLHMGIPFQEAAMGVACQQMIDARASGVMYTRNPMDPLENRILINAVWGLGPYAVDGIVPPDTYTFSKDSPPVLISSRISEKSARLKAASGGDVVEEAVSPELKGAACLTESQARTLAEYGLRLESYFATAQDVEWALDDQGRLTVLQARPLHVESAETGKKAFRGKSIEGYEILIESGDIACAGIGCGPACHVRTETDLVTFPDGGVLISVHSSPQLVMAMGKTQAIVTDAGNIAGHMASLAREYMVPSLLNTVEATTRIPQGTEITVDAYNGRIYRGRVAELLDSVPRQVGFMKSTPAYQALRRRADLIVPLNLVDPKAAGFAAERCRTIHDIMRFIHEKSYEEIFQLGDLVTERGRLSVRLRAPIPIDLYLIDLGGGLEVDATRVAVVTPDQIRSAPCQALIQGMLHEGLVSAEPRPVNLGGFFSVMSRQLFSPPNIEVERFGDRSYAIVSDRYLNFSSRVGYHYSILDSYCGKTPAKNYINFEFKGGAADDLRRNRRARVIEKVLTSLGFLVNTVSDRVTARYAKVECSEIQERLDQLGRLLIYTRQMDMLMNDESLVNKMADCFLSANYCLVPEKEADSSAENSGPSPQAR